MNRYVYSVWFQDQTADPLDQDYEWVACFVVESENAEAAQLWGDHLAKQYVSRNIDNLLLSSAVRAVDSSDEVLPLVIYGQEPVNIELGW